MKKTTNRKTKKLALQRDIIRALTHRDLQHAQGGTCAEPERHRGGCGNPVYSALEDED